MKHKLVALLGLAFLISSIASVAPMAFAVVNHDVAITALYLPADQTYHGWNVTINVTAANLGDINETFDVALYYNSTLISSQTVTDLAPSTSTDLHFVWNTSKPPAPTYPQTYTISANASVVPFETNTGNNQLSGQIKLKYLCDVNGDDVVDVHDYQALKTALPSLSGESNWDPQADVNNDGVVDGKDYQMVKKKVGKTPT